MIRSLIGAVLAVAVLAVIAVILLFLFVRYTSSAQLSKDQTKAAQTGIPTTVEGAATRIAQGLNPTAETTATAGQTVNTPVVVSADATGTAFATAFIGVGATHPPEATLTAVPTSTPVPTPTAKQLPTPMPVPTSTSAPTSTPAPTKEPTATAVPTATNVPPTATPAPTAAPTATTVPPTQTPTPVPTATKAPTAVPTPTATPVALPWQAVQSGRTEWVLPFGDGNSQGMSGQNAANLGWGQEQRSCATSSSPCNPLSYIWHTQVGTLSNKLYQRPNGYAIVPLTGLKRGQDYTLYVYAEYGYSTPENPHTCDDSWEVFTLSPSNAAHPEQATARLGSTQEQYPGHNVVPTYVFTISAQNIDVNGRVILVFHNTTSKCTNIDSAAIAGIGIQEK